MHAEEAAVQKQQRLILTLAEVLIHSAHPAKKQRHRAQFYAQVDSQGFVKKVFRRGFEERGKGAKRLMARGPKIVLTNLESMVTLRSERVSIIVSNC